jgi:hypothetical protein
VLPDAAAAQDGNQDGNRDGNQDGPPAARDATAF